MCSCLNSNQQESLSTQSIRRLTCPQLSCRGDLLDSLVGLLMGPSRQDSPQHSPSRNTQVLLFPSVIRPQQKQPADLLRTLSQQKRHLKTDTKDNISNWGGFLDYYLLWQINSKITAVREKTPYPLILKTITAV